MDNRKPHACRWMNPQQTSRTASKNPPFAQSRMKRNKIISLAVMVITIYLLHQDFWNWKKADPLVFGYLPIGLAYHAAYSVLASAMMWILVKLAWPRELDEMEAADHDRNPEP